MRFIGDIDDIVNIAGGYINSDDQYYFKMELEKLLSKQSLVYEAINMNNIKYEQIRINPQYYDKETMESLIEAGATIMTEEEIKIMGNKAIFAIVIPDEDLKGEIIWQNLESGSRLK